MDLAWSWSKASKVCIACLAIAGDQPGGLATNSAHVFGEVVMWLAVAILMNVSASDFRSNGATGTLEYNERSRQVIGWVLANRTPSLQRRKA